MLAARTKIVVGIMGCTLLLGCAGGDDPLPSPSGPGGALPGAGDTGAGSGAGGGGAGGRFGGAGGAMTAGPDGGVAGTGGAGGVGPTPSRTVTWTFPALVPDPKRGLVFPTYVAHLLGSKLGHKLPTDLACATLDNAGEMLEATLVIRFPVYGVDTTQNVRFPAATTTRACVKPTFDFMKLYAIRDATPGRIEVELRAGGTLLGADMRNISIAPVNEIAWDVPGIPLLEMRDLSAVFATPKAREVDQLQRLAAENSVWKGFGGGDPYKRTPHRRAVTLETKTQVRELMAIETGETVSWKVLKVAEGPMAEVEVYVFTPAQYDAWIKGTGTTATKIWKAVEGTEQTGTTLPAGAYHFIVANQSAERRTIEWARSATRHDVADDVLRSIYGALRKLDTRYSNIPGTYFADWQHVRRADEVLAALSANCIDGSLLFASVLELLGMEPVLIFKTGHAYVGVRSRPGSAVVWPVETTAIGTAEYERASVFAQESLSKDRSDPLYRVVDIKDMRTRGILPLPQ